jgi:hypothetical protein
MAGSVDGVWAGAVAGCVSAWASAMAGNNPAMQINTRHGKVFMDGLRKEC